MQESIAVTPIERSIIHLSGPQHILCCMQLSTDVQMLQHAIVLEHCLRHPSSAACRHFSTAVQIPQHGIVFECCLHQSSSAACRQLSIDVLMLEHGIIFECCLVNSSSSASRQLSATVQMKQLSFSSVNIISTLKYYIDMELRCPYWKSSSGACRQLSTAVQMLQLLSLLSADLQGFAREHILDRQQALDQVCFGV